MVLGYVTPGFLSGGLFKKNSYFYNMNREIEDNFGLKAPYDMDTDIEDFVCSEVFKIPNQNIKVVIPFPFPEIYSLNEPGKN